MIKNISSNTTLIGQTIIPKTVPWVSVSFLEPRQDSVIMSAMEVQLDYHGAWPHWSSQELITYWQVKKGQEGQSTIESWTELLNHLVKLVPTEQEHGEINMNVTCIDECIDKSCSQIFPGRIYKLNLHLCIHLPGVPAQQPQEHISIIQIPKWPRNEQNIFWSQLWEGVG